MDGGAELWWRLVVVVVGWVGLVMVAGGIEWCFVVVLFDRVDDGGLQ